MEDSPCDLVTRPAALFAAIAGGLLAVSGAGGAHAQTPKGGGTVVIASVEFPCLNVLVSQCLNPVSAAVLYGAYEIGPGYGRRPKLVSHVDVMTKPPFTLTYHIRPKARWSDGVPITSRDFEFTYRARLKYPTSEDDPHKTRVLRVRRVDAKTVRVVLRSRFFFWRESLFDLVLPQHALQGQDLETVWRDAIDDPRTGRSIGSGAFLFEDWDRGNELVLRRNPNYWGPHRAYLDRIVLRFRADALDSDVADLFREGEVDIIQRQLSEDLVSALRQVSGIRLRFPPDAGWEHLDIRMGVGGHPALVADRPKNKLVRRALAYGIDRVAIVRELLADIEGTPRPLDNVLLRSSNRSYRPNWSGYRYRPDEARRLLGLAGCRRGVDSVYVCAGRRLSFHFVSRSSPERRVRTLELIQAQLKRIGIEALPVYASQAGHDQLLQAGTFDVTLFAFFGPGAEAGEIKELYGCGGSQNHIGYCQRLVTRDLDQSDKILDAERRARVLNKADARIAKDVPTIPLFEVPLVVAVRSTIRGFTSVGFISPMWNAENWWLAE